jgi:thiamine-phosphate pyrophosphorylase
VHLPASGLPVAEVHRQYPALLIGASCHNLDELRRAEQGGADFAVFGPVFQPLSKESATLPLGVEKLAEAVRTVRTPVLALGGITIENAGEFLRAGAAGLAAITLFQKSADLKETVERLRELNR